MRFLIVGGGIGGVTVAQKLRALDSRSEITVLEAEPILYYLRPGLIDLLAGRKSLSEITPFPPVWYESHGIRYRPGVAVVGLDPARRRVTLASGEELSYERLLLALGAQPARPEIPGQDRAGVFSLRSAADAERIRTHAQTAKRALVLGGGWLGIEAGRALHDLGLEVTILERGPWPLSRQLDREGAEVLTAILAEKGLAIRTEASCGEILGLSTATGVRLTTGELLEAEMFLIATGISPRLGLAQEAGLHVNQGIIVDDELRTSAPDIYAVGDVAEWSGQVYGNIPAAREQAQIAAQNMAQPGSARYSGTTPAHTLKVAGVDLLCRGDTQPKGGPLRELRRAVPGRYLKFVLDEEGRLRGAILLGAPELADQVESWIRAGSPLEAEVRRLVEP